MQIKTLMFRKLTKGSNFRWLIMACLCFSFIIAQQKALAQAVCLPNPSVNVDAPVPDAQINFTIDVNDVNNSAAGNTILGLSLTPNVAPQNPITGNCSAYPAYEVEVWLHVTTAAGQPSSCPTTVQLIDNHGPFIECLNNTVYLDADGEWTLSTGDVAESHNNCQLGSFTFDGTDPDVDCNDLGSYNVDLIATDGLGLSTVQSCNVIVADTLPPIADCKSTLNVYLDASGGFTLNSSDLDEQSSDNCGIVAFGISPVSFNCANAGTNIDVEFSVHDGSGNSSICTTTVSVFDTISPTVNVSTVPLGLPLDTDGEYSLTMTDLTASSTVNFFDNCTFGNDFDFSFDIEDFDCGALDTITPVKVTVIDAALNSTTRTVYIDIYDNIAPEAECVDEIDIVLDSDGLYTLTAAELDAGSTDNCSIYSSYTSPAQLTCSHVSISPVNVLLTVTDAAPGTYVYGGPYSDQCTTEVTVLDQTNPTVMVKDTTISYTDTSPTNPLTPAAITTQLDDACGVASAVLSQDVFDCDDIGTNMVTLTVKDFSGNSTVVTSMVTVVDDVSPVVGANVNTDVYLDANGSIVVSAWDVNNGSYDDCTNINVSLSPNTFDCDDLAAPVLVTLSVTDVSMNSSSQLALVTVMDTLGPTASCAPLSVTVDANGQATISAMDIDDNSSDNCGIKDTLISFTEMGGYMKELDVDCSNVGSAVDVWLRVTDDNNLADTCMTTITLVEGAAPVASVMDITVDLDASGNVTIIPNSVDNGSTGTCGTELWLSQTQFDCTEVGTHTLTFRVTDPFGNIDEEMVDVTIEDNLPPTIVTCTQFIGELDANGVFTLSDTSFVEVTDNCENYTVALSKTNFTCADLGPNQVTATFTDPGGNSIDCVNTINIIDVTPPVLDCRDTVFIELDPATNSFQLLSNTPSLSTVHVEDIDFGGSPSLPAGHDIIATLVTVNAPVIPAGEVIAGGSMKFCTDTDNNGFNERIRFTYTHPLSNAVQTVNVGGAGNDCAEKCVTIPLNSTVLAGTSISDVSAETLGSGINDICFSPNVSITYEINLLSDFEVDFFNTDPLEVCSGLNLSVSQNNFNCFHADTSMVTLTLTDESGNADNCDIVVVKTNGLELTLNNINPTYDLDANGFLEIFPWWFTSSDIACENVGASNLSITPSTFDCDDLGPQQVTITLTNDAGQSTSVTTTVTIEEAAGTNPCNNGCDDELTLQNAMILNGVYNVNDWILASGQIDGSSQSNDVYFYAPNEVTLNPGFEVELGATLLIDMLGCQAP